MLDLLNNNVQNNQFFISHKHDSDDGLPNLEEAQGKEPISEDDASTSSVVHTPLSSAFEKRDPNALSISSEVQNTIYSQGVYHINICVEQDLAHLTALTKNVKMSSEVRAYLHNIIVFMRLHRAVAGGISALATRHFITLVQYVFHHSLSPK